MERLSLKDEKLVLRQRFRELREAFVRESGPAASEKIKANLVKLVRDQGGHFEQICSYRPVQNEADPGMSPLTDYFFPKVDGKTMSFWRPKSEDAFVANKYGILEPRPEDSVPLDLKKPILVFTPALAADSLGRRIGSGLGFYDKFFQLAPKALRVGVVYHMQVSQSPLPAEGWDQLLDWLVTDKMILQVSKRSF